MFAAPAEEEDWTCNGLNRALLLNLPYEEALDREESVERLDVLREEMSSPELCDFDMASDLEAPLGATR